MQNISHTSQKHGNSLTIWLLWLFIDRRNEMSGCYYTIVLCLCLSHLVLFLSDLNQSDVFYSRLIMASERWFGTVYICLDFGCRLSIFGIWQITSVAYHCNNISEEPNILVHSQWLLSSTDKMTPAMVAKLAMQCTVLYADALKLLQLESIKSLWPKVNSIHVA